MSPQRRTDNPLAVAEAALEELLRSHASERAKDELEMQLDLREKFFTLVAHDLRTPLSTAAVCAELLQKKVRDEEAQLARRILDSVQRANRLIGDLLDANRLRAGHPIHIQLREADLVQIARTCLDDLAPIHKGRAKLKSPRALMGSFDTAAIRRAIDNLVVNAVKYGSETGSIEVSVHAQGEQAKIAIRNDGPHLSLPEVDALFRWHGRGEGSKQQGWGLGLMLVKGIAEAHGGEVRAESAPGSGMIFTLTFPLRPVR